MSEEFKREERYLVVKISKLADDKGDNMSRSEQIFRIAHFGKALVNAVVVEEDWPEYEPVWQMIERRMGGKPAVTAAEELAAVLHWRGKHDQAIKERDALQLRLNAADQRIDDAAHYMRRTVDLVMRDCGNSYANAWCEKLLVIAKSFGAYDGATIGNIIDLREALQAAEDGR